MKNRLFSKLILGGLLVSTVVGCQSIEDVKKVTPNGTEFQKYLSQLYLNFAQSEAKQYDWLDSQHFVNKAMKAAYGRQTAPEDLKKWNISKDHIEELKAARKQLVEVVYNEHMAEKSPELAAKAQFHFDCWVEQQEENWQEEDIRQCRDAFAQNIEELNRLAGENKKTAAIEEIDVFVEVDKKGNKKPQQAQLFQLIFTENTTDVPAIAAAEIARIIDYTTKSKNHMLVVNSYSNKLHNEDANLKLAKERAVHVKKKLKESGIKEENIIIFAFSDSKPSASSATEADKEVIEIIIRD